MAQIFYTLLYLHLLPFIVLRLFWRARKAPNYAKRIGERFALVPKRKDDAPLIWLHAVSVGEVIAAIPLVKQLQIRYPTHKICITTTTPTGSDRVRAAFADSVLHYYLPYDLPSLYVHFIAAINPSALIIMETELWPNLLLVCQDKAIPVVLANGRMSARSAKGYRRFSAITRPMLQRLQCIAAQSSADAERFIALGAKAENVLVTGSIKFDVLLDEVVYQRVTALRAQLNLPKHARKVAVFASTHLGEDELILPMIKTLAADDASFLALLVPRHPERFPVVANLAKQQGLNTVRISENTACNANTQLILGDTMGDMLAYYGLADIAFVGGSLIAHGGHNMLEPALWRKPILAGQYIFNFQTIADELVAENGLQLVVDVQALQQKLQKFLRDAQAFSMMGENAARVLQRNQGALQRLLDELAKVL